MKRLLLILALGVGFAVPAQAQAAIPHPLVYIANESESVTPEALATTVAAWQTAVSRDLAASWGTDATLTTDPAYAQSADMYLTLTDSIDCSGCLGYHWLKNGKPVSYVGVSLSATYNEDWRIPGSHELFEMLVDPWVNRLAQWHGRTWLVEVADPCESGLYAYWIDGVPISDFITPAWYGVVRGRRVDFTGGLKKPGAIGTHGYASFLDPSQAGGWGQVFGFHARRQGR